MNELWRASSCLADLAHALESGQDAGERVRRALRALRRLVPHDRCVLTNAIAEPLPRCFVEPVLPQAEHRRIADKAEALLRVLSDRAAVEPMMMTSNGRAAHLAVPLISLDELTGVLLVERDAGAYDVQDLQLLSVVGAQLGAYFATLRLHDHERKVSEALRKTIARRTQFLGLLSHELRNPLAPIGNALHVLEHVGADSEQATRARAVISRQFGHLSRLVNDLLDATRVTGGKVRVERTPVDVAGVVQRTVDDHRSLFAEAGIELAVQLPPAPVWVDGDPVRLSQVVGNLLVNAAKFSRAGGLTEVAVQREGAAALVRIRDDGVGISADVLKRLFEPFVQGDDTLERSRGGLGLGLALAKELVELHGGTIEARSAGSGCGAEFLIRLPPAARALARAPGAAAPSRAARPRRVLVVEDNADAAETLRDLLKLSGHAVDVAYDGGEALGRAVAFDPEVVLCDIGLPGMTGYDVARALRSAPGGAARLLVALTGYGLDEDRRRAMEAGFDAHLVKPVRPEQLDQLLASSRAPEPGSPGAPESFEPTAP